VTGSDDELRLVRDTATAVLARDASEPDGGDPLVRWRRFADADLVLMGTPEPIGGGWPAAVAAVVQLCGEQLASVPYAESALVAAPLLAAAGLSVPPGVATVADGTSGLVEPVGDGARLRLERERVAWASAAETVVVVVADGADEVIASIDLSDVAVTAGRNVAGEPRDRVDVDVVVARERWTAVPPGTAVELRVRGALSRSLAMAGAASAVLGMTIRYAGEREQFGRPIGRFQAMQHAIAELAGEVEAMRASADAAVECCVTSGFDSAAARLAVGAAKIQAGVGAAVVARVAHQVHGAIGTTREHPLHRATTRLWSWRDDFGSERAWQGDLAGTVLGGDPWEAITG
jgi:acyl-CoA dehydrogenase